MHVGHPSSEVRQSLANQLQMTPKSVQVWFQNRRQKLRGQQQAMAIAAASSSEPSAAVHPVMVQRQIDAVQQQVDDAGRREAVRPYPMQATPHAFEAAASAAAVMHTVQGYPLPRPGDLQTTTLPAHILSELASVSAAEQDLAQLANQLMQRKVALLDNIQRLEQQSAASRHGGHAVSLSPAYLATQAATMDFAAYKKYKETNEPFRASEPLQVPRPLASARLRAPASQLPARWATGARCLRSLGFPWQVREVPAQSEAFSASGSVSPYAQCDSPQTASAGASPEATPPHVSPTRADEPPAQTPHRDDALAGTPHLKAPCAGGTPIPCSPSLSHHGICSRRRSFGTFQRRRGAACCVGMRPSCDSECCPLLAFHVCHACKFTRTVDDSLYIEVA